MEEGVDCEASAVAQRVKLGGSHLRTDLRVKDNEAKRPLHAIDDSDGDGGARVSPGIAVERCSIT